jgi:hypothetical protein
MKMRPIAVSFALVLALRLVGVAGFAPPPSVLNYPAQLPPGTILTGPVTNIDPVNRMIQIKDSTGILRTVRIDGSTQILRNDKPTDLSRLSYGDIVTVSR